MSELILLILLNFVDLLNNILYKKLKLPHQDIKIGLYIIYEGKTTLCIKMFDQLKANTSTKIIILCTAIES